jgi:hypothetical protein
MIRIERVPEDVAANAKVIFAQLLGPGLAVMAALAERCELIEVWKRIATAPDWSPMINNGSGLNSTDLKACLTKRVFPEFVPAQPLPTPRCVRPLSHPSPY